MNFWIVLGAMFAVAITVIVGAAFFLAWILGGGPDKHR